VPIQTGAAAQAIAGVCRQLLTASQPAVSQRSLPSRRAELPPASDRADRRTHELAR
jgi:hypothetical protein